MIILPEEFRRYSNGQAELAHPGGTIEQALQSACGPYPELAIRLLDGQGHLRSHLVVLHNSQVVTSEQAISQSVGKEESFEIYTAASGG